MAYQKQIFHALILIQIVALVSSKHLRQRIGRDARLPSADDEPMHSEEIREVRILPKSYVTHIGDIIDGPIQINKSLEEKDEEEIMEKEFLEHMSKIPLESLQREESIESARMTQINGIQNMPFDKIGRDIFPNAPGGIQSMIPPPRRPVPGRSTVRPPMPPDGRLPNGLYTDIGRVIPINDYMQSRRLPSNTAQPIPVQNSEFRFENSRQIRPVRVGQNSRFLEPIQNEEEPPKEEEEDLIKGLLERIRPGERNVGGSRRRWALYFGHVFLQALNTLIDGTQVALKGGAIK